MQYFQWRAHTRQGCVYVYVYVYVYVCVCGHTHTRSAPRATPQMPQMPQMPLTLCQPPSSEAATNSEPQNPEQPQRGSIGSGNTQVRQGGWRADGQLALDPQRHGRAWHT